MSDFLDIPDADDQGGADFVEVQPEEGTTQSFSMPEPEADDALR